MQVYSHPSNPFKAHTPPPPKTCEGLCLHASSIPVWYACLPCDISGTLIQGTDLNFSKVVDYLSKELFAFLLFLS